MVRQRLLELAAERRRFGGLAISGGSLKLFEERPGLIEHGPGRKGGPEAAANNFQCCRGRQTAPHTELKILSAC
jgi:hypothetical protein